MHPPTPPLTAATLAAEHYDRLYRYAYRLSGSHFDAEDLTQQTFLTAHANLGQLRDPRNAQAWLCTVLRNLFRRSLGARLETVSVPPDLLPDATEAEADDFPVDAEELQLALAELPEEFRTPLVLFYFQDFSYKEIAAQIEVPVGTVMSRLARAKAWLRQRLGSLAAVGT